MELKGTPNGLCLLLEKMRGKGLTPEMGKELATVGTQSLGMEPNALLGETART